MLNFGIVMGLDSITIVLAAIDLGTWLDKGCTTEANLQALVPFGCLFFSMHSSP